MRLVYSHPYGDHPRGSGHKYGAWLAELYGCTSISRASAIELERAGAELVFCEGDGHRFFESCNGARVPYVLVEQDVFSLRMGIAHEPERAMLEHAVAVLFTSEDHEAYLRAQGVRLPPSLVVPLRPRRADLEFDPLPKLEGRHLVYAGGLIDWGRRETSYGYRAYHRIFERFVAAGWTVHLYSHPGRPQLAREYSQLGCVIHPFVEHRDLYRELSQFTASFHGYNAEGVPARAFAYTQTCRPNKTWDGLGAGIPTISFQGGNSGRVLEQGGWGICLRDLSDEELARCEPELLPAIDPEARAREVLEADEPAFRAWVEAAMRRARSPRAA
jgi:hypothetical protein